MSDWQERITHETAPAIQAEHELRYRVASSLIGSAGIWVDLGCGNGLAAAAALGEARPQRSVLIDLDDAAVRLARATLQLQDAVGHVGDLTDSSFLEVVGTDLLAIDGKRVVTCFEVVEHLESFLPLLQWSVALAREHDVTFVLSVPNDAFWAIQNPYHQTAWGEGAFEEMSRLLPEARTLLRQVALTGSATLDWDTRSASHALTVQTGDPGSVATHFIAAYGPCHEEVMRGARVVQADMLEQRRWERERESNLAVAERRLSEQHDLLREQHDQLREHVRQFEEWRAYIHALERRLGEPLSGGAVDSESSDWHRGAEASPADEPRS
jgi:SAM-dependent methyltransferase